MKKLFTLLCLFGILSAQAQLPDGSVCPDFTGVDIDGNTWNLYDLLDDGYTVIIDVSATWCGPCWSYHETGALEDVYTDYGPDGTGEIMVLWVEGDATTNEDCIYDLPGCNSSTMGDWTDGTDFPIIDDSNIANLLEIAYYPTIFKVCQNRIITEVGQISADDIYASIDDCAVPFGENNAGILGYEGESGNFCGELNFEPAVLVQNLGSSNLTAATVELWVNSTLTETVDWTGDLGPWGMDNIVFSSLNVSESTTIEIIITDVNGVIDEDESNNNYTAEMSIATATSNNYLTVNVMTDAYPTESSWELYSDAGLLLFSGGGYSASSTLYSDQVIVPVDGCYSFHMIDSYGDGILAPGYFEVVDGDGTVLIDGSTVTEAWELLIDPILIEGATATEDAGAIINYSGESGSICLDYEFSPVITIQNQGANTMTSAVIEVSDNDGVIFTQEWSGTLETSESADVVLDPIIVSETNTITYSLIEINEVTVEDPTVSEVNAEFVQNYTESITWNFELQTDSWAEELYWQITNGNGDVVAYGGNEDVGVDGGGTGLADPSAPGAYASGELVQLEIELPNAIDCYDFLIVDSYGDGLVDGGGGYVLITDENNETIINNDYTTLNFENDHTLIVASPAVSVNEFDNVSSFNIYPNPAKNSINARFELVNNMEITIEIFNVQGQSLITLNENSFTSGVNEVSIDLSTFSEGIYYLKASNANKTLTKRFVVLD